MRSCLCLKYFTRRRREQVPEWQGLGNCGKPKTLADHLDNASPASHTEASLSDTLRLLPSRGEWSSSCAERTFPLLPSSRLLSLRHPLPSFQTSLTRRSASGFCLPSQNPSSLRPSFVLSAMPPCPFRLSLPSFRRLFPSCPPSLPSSLLSSLLSSLS